MKSIAVFLGLFIFCVTVSGENAAASDAWQCIAEAQVGVHPAEVFYGSYESTQSAAQNSALDACHRGETNSGNCKIQSCWTGGESTATDQTPQRVIKVKASCKPVEGAACGPQPGCTWVFQQETKFESDWACMDYYGNSCPL